MACMLCKETGFKTYNINSPCGESSNTVKDSIVEFLGDKISSHLKHDDCVCYRCLSQLRKIILVKYKLYDIIVRQDNAESIEHYWEYFHSNNENHNSEIEYRKSPMTPCLTPYSGGNNPNTPTPNSLWYVNSSREYNPNIEAKAARRYKVKAERASRLSLKSRAGSTTDAEVAGIMTKKRGRKSAGSLPKIISKKSKSAHNEADRTVSSLSNRSFMSYTKPRKYFSSLSEDQRYKKPLHRTRSVSRLEGFFCPECLKLFDLTELTIHMTFTHKKMPLYKCDECQISFTTGGHLQIHSRMHNMQPYMCTMCGVYQKNLYELQQHIDKHFEFSIPCPYCDFCYLSKPDLNQHMSEKHRKQKKIDQQSKIKQKKKEASIIVEMINYLDEPPPAENEDNNTESEVRSYILDIESRPTLTNRSYWELDYQLRFSSDLTVELPKQLSSLGDDLVCTQPGPVEESDSSDNRNRRKGFNSLKFTPMVPKHKTAEDELTDVIVVNMEDEVSQKPISTCRSDVESRNSEVAEILGRRTNSRISMSDNSFRGSRMSNLSNHSDHSDSIQVETHYFDGKVFQSEIDLEEIEISNITETNNMEHEEPS